MAQLDRRDCWRDPGLGLYREHYSSGTMGMRTGDVFTSPMFASGGRFYLELIGTFSRVSYLCIVASTPIKENSIAYKQAVNLGLGALRVAGGAAGVAIGCRWAEHGYAINPRATLGADAHCDLPIPGKRDSDWSYAGCGAGADRRRIAGGGVGEVDFVATCALFVLLS